ncbi:MAG: OmpA family protein, partial [Muribaculaceae bacterium]|nr:OmpA family protein [Muribaculaceae bacterium]
FKNRKPEVVKEVNNNYSSVRFVFFRVGSSKITADQQPNIEMIADYMKHHPKSKVVIKGYASPEGNYDFNVKLAKNRAESVKNTLVSTYKIAVDRITAEGEGIGHMFKEDSWNRVSICTLDED